jgi:hypothetical protein
MPIPLPIEAPLAEIDDLHNGTLTTLRVISRCNPRDADALRQRLRAGLQVYVDKVIAVANETA